MYNFEKFMTEQTKKTLNEIIIYLDTLIGGASLIDDRFEKHKRAILVFRIIINFINKEPNNTKLSNDDIQIAIGVLEEITIHFKKDKNSRTVIKFISFGLRLLLLANNNE